MPVSGCKPPGERPPGLIGFEEALQLLAEFGGTDSVGSFLFRLGEDSSWLICYGVAPTKPPRLRLGMASWIFRIPATRAYD
jgi:hypothetical protein